MAKKPENTNNVGIDLGVGVYISPDARIHPSVRGSKIVIGAHTQIYDFVCIRCVGGSGDLIIGEHCYINPGCVLYTGNGIVLGDYVLLAPGVMLVPANHASSRTDMPIRHQGFEPSKGGIIINDDVWIGANSVVVDGVSIGRGSIIGAGSVVTSNVPEFEVWAGIPARKLRSRRIGEEPLPPGR